MFVLLHELRPLVVYERAEGQAAPPGGREVGDADSSVALGLLLAPGEQPAGSHLRLCERGRADINMVVCVGIQLDERVTSQSICGLQQVPLWPGYK